MEEIINKILGNVAFQFVGPDDAHKLDLDTVLARQPKKFSDLDQERRAIKQAMYGDVDEEFSTTPLPGSIEELFPDYIGTLNPFEYGMADCALYDYQELNLRSLISTQLSEISKSDNGKGLLTEVAGHIDNDRTFQIVVTNEIPNKYNNHKVYLNPWETISAHNERGEFKLFKLSPIIKGKAVIYGEDMTVTRDGLSLFHDYVFHELSHYRDDMKSGGLGDRSPYPPGSRPISLFPMEYAHMEHRAVFNISPADFSELPFRIQMHEPLRYSYQRRDRNFVEPMKTVIKHAIKFVPTHEQISKAQELYQLLQKLPNLTDEVMNHQLDTKHMKLHVSRSIVESKLANQPGLTKSEILNDMKLDALELPQQSDFVLRMTSPERIAKLAASKDKIQLMNNHLATHPIFQKFKDLNELTTLGFSPTQLAIAYVNSNRKRAEFMQQLQKSLVAKTKRNSEEIGRLIAMRLFELRGPKYIPTGETPDPMTFQMLLGSL